MTSASPTSDRAALAGIEQLLLQTVGVNPADATPVDLMQAVSQLARRQLSTRWVQTQRREKPKKRAAFTTCRWSS